MRFFAKLWWGFKIGLGIANKLQDKGVVKIKELPKVTAVVEAVEDAIAEHR